MFPEWLHHCQRNEGHKNKIHFVLSFPAETFPTTTKKPQQILLKKVLTAHIDTCHGYRGAPVTQSHSFIWTKDCKKAWGSRREKGCLYMLCQHKQWPVPAWIAEPGGAPRGSIGRSVSAVGFGFHRGIVGFTVEGLQGRAKRERSPGCRGSKVSKGQCD